jgi:hypothetical protein
MSDMMALTNFLKDKLFDVYIDQAPSAGSILESGFFGSSGASIDKTVYRADQLIHDACAVKITPEILKTYTAEWQEKAQLEKERQAELELLKATNHSLTFKVRQLEERVQEHDQEHAELATDLVKTKVENEELRDENESLKGQVQELRAVIEKQPEEVEARLKSEMDRLMKRNQEVHEENAKLEEEMSEMEKTLVETKMTLAEVCLLPCYLDHMLMTPAGEFSTRSSEAEMDRPPQSCWRLIYPLPLVFDHATSRPSRLVQHSSRQFNSTLSSFEPHFSSSGSTTAPRFGLSDACLRNCDIPFPFRLRLPPPANLVRE